jgi:PDZ domain-containing protein
MNGDTRAASVPTPVTPPEGTTRRFAAYWIAFASCAGLLATAFVAGGFLTLPYYSFAPGNAYDTTALVSIGGEQPSYPPDGHIYFLTVRLPHVSVLEGVVAWADRDQDVIRQEGILGDRSEAENRALQAALMRGSASDAVAVALDRLGIPRNPTGSGAIVTEVVPDSPANGQLDVADVIVAVDGSPVLTADDLGALVGARAPGDTILLDVEGFDGTDRQVSVTLAARPDDPARGFLGVGSEARDYDPGSPFPISIDSGRVGGPSAGLAFTLAIIDVLTDGDLTGGRRVAVTGTIEPDGSVGVVGGVAQKSAAASAEGAEVLIVPSGEEAEAQRLGYDLEVIGVDDLEGALAALEAIGGDPLPAPPAA